MIKVYLTPYAMSASLPVVYKPNNDEVAHSWYALVRFRGGRSQRNY